MEIDVSPQEQTVYELIGSDTNSCFQKSSFVVVDLITDLKIALPTAFSPNGDGVNDVFFVQAWFIKELLVFKIYNRWGQLVF